MRSFSEIRFRIAQELNNLRLLLSPPAAAVSDPRAVLPDPAFAGPILDLAESICAHRFPLLGNVVETGPEIRWRRDYIRGIESGTRYFRRIPYLDVSKVGDHKLIWELNRHQHLIVLAQAWRLGGDNRFLDEIPLQIESWWEQNPFLRGINWASALEVAFRALSWLWILHLGGADLPDDFRQRLIAGVLQHGAYLENNLSVYFSPNTHLLGEAVALHAIGTVLPDGARSARWRSRGAEIVAAEIVHQVREDGSHFEQSSAYHVYALDLFLLHARLGKVDEIYRERLRRMADYLAALSADDGTIPLLGDDDGGNLFHPYGNQRRYGARTLAACSAVSRPAALFRDAGVAVLSNRPAHIVADTRAFGHAGAGHSHAHALSVVCRYAGEDILVDPGTYTYTAEPAWRDRFRGTAFHNTIRVDGSDQAVASGAFRWTDKPVTEIIRWATNKEWTYLDASCTYRDIRHERHLVWLAARETLLVVDVVKSAGSAEHLIEQFWHCGTEVSQFAPGAWRIGRSAVLAVPPSSDARFEVGGDFGWWSESPGVKAVGPVIIIRRRTTLPAVMGAMLFLGASRQAIAVTTELSSGRIIVRANELSVELSESGDPLIVSS